MRRRGRQAQNKVSQSIKIRTQRLTRAAKLLPADVVQSTKTKAA